MIHMFNDIALRLPNMVAQTEQRIREIANVENVSSERKAPVIRDLNTVAVLPKFCLRRVNTTMVRAYRLEVEISMFT